MIIWKDEQRLLDTDQARLTYGVLNFNDYKGASEKVVKTDSISFNDSYVYNTDTFQGYESTLEVLVKNKQRKYFIDTLRKGNRITLPREKGKYREYYINGQIQVTYYLEDVSKLTIPIYFKAFVYENSKNTITLTKGLIKTIVNTGNVYAEPVYKITGNGNLIFAVNGKSHTLKNAVGGYIINCKNKEQDVSDLQGNLKNVTSEYDGDFPTLQVGENKVQLITGDSLTIEVNWRSLD